jgi:hypothetical protein
VERARLRLLEEYHDPLTVSQLEAIGVGEGWYWLGVGAGGGSITRLLAERVGCTGSVLAVDLDTSLLDELVSDRVEVRLSQPDGRPAAPGRICPRLRTPASDVSLTAAVWSLFLDAAMAGGSETVTALTCGVTSAESGSSMRTPTTSHVATPAGRSRPASCR